MCNFLSQISVRGRFPIYLNVCWFCNLKVYITKAISQVVNFLLIYEKKLCIVRHPQATHEL